MGMYVCMYVDDPKFVVYNLKSIYYVCSYSVNFCMILYSKKLWWRKNLGEFGKSPQFAKFFANFFLVQCRAGGSNLLLVRTEFLQHHPLLACSRSLSS